MDKKTDLVVVGSLSRDLVIHTHIRPRVGETVIGSAFHMYVGGKGNNQAIAATRAGASVEMIGKIGVDSFGEVVYDTLKSNQIGCQHLLRDKNFDTGIANIIVDSEGDNSIVIVPGANHGLTPDDVIAASETIKSAKVMLLQLEIKIETAWQAAQIARQNNVTVILNPAPAVSDIKVIADLLKLVDILIPNELEASVLSGIEIVDEKSALQAAEKLRSFGPKTVILTLGAKGSLLTSGDGGYTRIPTHAVKVVDTTAAGDAFCGALAASLAKQTNISEAVKYGSAAGALAVTKGGAEPSLPYAKEINELMKMTVS